MISIRLWLPRPWMENTIEDIDMDWWCKACNTTKCTILVTSLSFSPGGTREKDHLPVTGSSVASDLHVRMNYSGISVHIQVCSVDASQACTRGCWRGANTTLFRWVSRLTSLNWQWPRRKYALAWAEACRFFSIFWESMSWTLMCGV